MLKKIIKDIIAFVIVMLIIAWVYNKWFFEADLQTHAEMINTIREVPEHTSVLYLGESSNYTSHPSDTDKRRISAMIGDYYPQLVVSDITKPASHAGIYSAFLQAIPKSTQIETVIVTLNLRSFNAQWIYSDLETSLQKSLVLLRDYPPIVNRALLSFKSYPIISKAENQELIFDKWEDDTFDLPFAFPYKNVREWDKAMATKGAKDAQGNIDYKLTELACHYVKGYAFQIDTSDNVRIDEFNEIVEVAKARNWQLVFNLMAENVEKAQELVGDTLVYMIRENAKILKSYYTQKGVLVVDNLEAVENRQFIDQSWTTEHYAEKGRRSIANNVATALKKWYAKDYEAYTPDTTALMTTDSVFVAPYSGASTAFWQRTSAYVATTQIDSVFDMQPFSTTFVMSKESRLLYDKQSITIDVQHKPNTQGATAKLVIEANGEFIQKYWKSFDLNTNENKTNQWLNFHHQFTIPDYIRQADEFKIYVYNNGKPSVNIKGIKVVFHQH